MSDTATYENLCEIAWLEKLSKGNPAALRYFYERYAGKIVAFAEKILASREDGEDISHSIFINLWEQRADAVSIKSVDSYLCRMTRNAVIDILRQRARDARYRQQNFHSGESAEEETMAEETEIETDRRLLKAIEQLPEPQRSIIRMSRFDGLSYQQIAEKLDISPHTVHYHVSKALVKLRCALTCLLLVFLSTLG